MSRKVFWPVSEAARSWSYDNIQMASATLYRWCIVVSVTLYRWCTLVSVTFNRWRTVVSGTWKYDDPRLNMSHEGAARVWHVQPRVVLFPCPTNDCVSYVLSSDQLNKLFSPLCLQNSIPVGYDLNTQARGLIIGVSKTLCDFDHEILLKKNKLLNYRHIPTFCNLLRVPRCRQN